jgi:superfamily II DNA or RNA helicase/CRISPR/Cas system-associated exonuclease Cas4 (RecB family)
MLEVSSRVRLRDGRTGIIVELRDGFARVVIDDGSQLWSPAEELVEELGLVERFLKGEIDEGIDFILAMDAYRLLTEYKFNPYVLASSTKITIYPHQIDEVIHILDRQRIMVADEVGLGKTITALLVASELKARGIAKRMLFVVPKALVPKWVREMNERFELDAKVLDSAFLKAEPKPFKKDEFIYVSSMDFLKQDHVIGIMNDAPADLFVVVDEAHKLVPGTERFKLGKKLSGKAGHMLFLTATPHRGDNEEYLEIMRLLDIYILDVESAKALLIRNVKEDVVDLDGREVFPKRSSKTIRIPLSREEYELHRMVDGYVMDLIERASDRRELNALRFLGIILRRRASSSPMALKRTLERRLEKLRHAPVTDVSKAIARMKEAEEEFDEGEYEEAEDEIIGLPAMDRRAEQDALKRLIEKLENLSGADSKFEHLMKFIEEVKRGDPSAKIVVFSEYRDTVDYLYEKLSEKYKVAKIDGRMNADERQRVLDESRKPDGPEIIVCTDAAGEGVDMQFANVEINYDLPWNPNRLEQRMGRIHRIGQKRNVYYYNFVLDGTVDGLILSRVLEKIEAIKAAMGEKVYDVIGRLITEEEIVSLYQELAKAPSDRWEPALKRIDGIIEERKRILEEVDKLLTGYRLDRSKLEDMRKVVMNAVDKNEVKRFVETYLNRHGGKMEVIKPEEEVYRIYLPIRLAHRIEGSAIVTGTFSSEMAQEKGYHYLALGNRYVMEMMKDAAKQCVSIFRHSTVEGLLYLYRLVVRDGAGRERDGKLIALLYSDGKVIEVDPRFVWDLEPAKDQPLDEYQIGLVEEGLRATTKEAYRIMGHLKDGVDRKLQEIKRKAKSAIIAYYSQKIKECDEKIQDYERKLHESPHFKGLITIEDNKRRDYNRRLNEELKRLDTEYQTTAFYEPVGLAIIVREKDGLDERLVVERAGIKAVIEYEQKRAGGDQEKLEKIKDVSAMFKGYDVESFDRVIEVKSFKDTGAVEMTSHEWQTALRMKDMYWLYVVENALTKPDIHPINNPAERFRDKVKKVPITDYKYIIEDWKT